MVLLIATAAHRARENFTANGTQTFLRRAAGRCSIERRAAGRAIGRPMKQLAFELGAVAPPTLNNFISGRNAELVHHLQCLAEKRTDERFIYLWGPPASGRSHLLKGATSAARAAGVDAAYVTCRGDTPLPADLARHQYIAVDDVERLDAAGQIALFNAYNATRERHGALLASGSVPPARLQLRADLVTRLGWGLVYEVRALSDQDKVQAMRQRAADRGFSLGDDVLTYLMTRAPRDMATLLALIDALDRSSLEAKRPVSVALAREILQSLAAQATKAEEG